MANHDYVSKNVQKIIKEEGHAYPENIALAAAWILGNFKGTELKIYNVGLKSSITDYFVLATANNATQANAMAEEITVQLKSHDHKIISVEGTENAEWVLIDAGDIFVHIFSPSARKSYDLDKIWEESAQLSIPSDYYFSTPTEAKKSDDSFKDYF